MSIYRLRGFFWRSRTYFQFSAANDAAALQQIVDATIHYGAVDRQFGANTWMAVGYVDYRGELHPS